MIRYSSLNASLNVSGLLTGVYVWWRVPTPALIAIAVRGRDRSVFLISVEPMHSK